MIKPEFPYVYDPADNVTVELPRGLVVALGGLISRWEWRNWKTEDDWERAQQAALLLQERLLG